MKRGTLLVVSGFSGAGKGTVLSKVLEKRTDLYYSVSFTTRAPRTGEQDGVNYHFVTREAFQERIDRGEFLEYAEYVGNFYGTSMAVIREKLDQGVDVILEIESQGAAKVRQKMPDWRASGTIMRSMCSTTGAWQAFRIPCPAWRCVPPEWIFRAIWPWWGRDAMPTPCA